MAYSTQRREPNFYRSLFINTPPVLTKRTSLSAIRPTGDITKISICRDTAAQTLDSKVTEQTSVMRRGRHQKLQTETLKKMNVVALKECMCKHKLYMRILVNFWKMYRAIKGNYFIQLFGRFLLHIIYMDMGLITIVMAYNATRQCEMVPSFLENMIGGEIKPFSIIKYVAEMIMCAYGKIF